MLVHGRFDPVTSTLSYLVWDPNTLDAVIIDPVLDFDPESSVVTTASADALIADASARGLRVHYTLDTHIHADHLTAAQHIRGVLGAGTVIGSRVTEVQQTFGVLLALGQEVARDGSQFDVLLDDGDTLKAGTLRIRAIHAPGHTPACTVYHIDDSIFTGDVMFMPDFGTGRCDFPGGSAGDLYDSVVQKLYTLPDATRVFVGHDYQPGGRPLAFETTIGAAKTANKQLRGDTSRDQFTAWRTARDATLSNPRLLFQSVQINCNAGILPGPLSDPQPLRSPPMDGPETA